ncbi:MAG: hypothetical protein R3E87_04615 [Burkholderiaceae bacterium]
MRQLTELGRVRPHARTRSGSRRARRGLAMRRCVVRLVATSALMLPAACGDYSLSLGAFCVRDDGWIIRLTVIDRLRSPLDGVLIDWQVDGGRSRTDSCDPLGFCDLDIDRGGRLNLRAQRAGYVPALLVIDLDGDPCRYPSREFTIVLQRA